MLIIERVERVRRLNVLSDGQYFARKGEVRALALCSSCREIVASYVVPSGDDAEERVLEIVVRQLLQHYSRLTGYRRQLDPDVQVDVTVAVYLMQGDDD